MMDKITQPTTKEIKMFQLNEGLEQGDLSRLVHTELHIDEFKSKLGRDEDVVVISFKVVGKEPAADLVSFIEKGYTWVIDADVSSGEMEDGDYIVFVEAERDKDIAKNIIEMMQDIMNLTEQELSDWRVRYYTSTKDHALDEESLTEIIPSNPEEYRRKFGNEELDSLKSAAGVEVTTKAPKNDYTESLRIASGIK
jgi:hypothetical protein